MQYTEQYGIELESVYPYTAQDGTCMYNQASTVFSNGGYANVTQNNQVAMNQAILTQPISVCVEAD